MVKDILFIGSSIVAGLFGIDWISKLPPKDGFKYHNYGINGAQVPTIINLIQSNKISVKPHAIVIMVGGNDVTNSVPIEKYGGFMSERHGRPRTNPKQYGEEMEELIVLIEKKWGSISIGLFNLKPQSEKVDGNLNRIVREFNDSLYLLSQKHSQITYLDMYSKMIEALDGHEPSPKADDIEYVVDVGRMLYVQVMRILTLGAYTLNSYSDARQFYLYCDGLHFNERAGDIVLKVIHPYIEKVTSL